MNFAYRRWEMPVRGRRGCPRGSLPRGPNVRAAEPPRLRAARRERGGPKDEGVA